MDMHQEYIFDEDGDSIGFPCFRAIFILNKSPGHSKQFVSDIFENLLSPSIFDIGQCAYASPQGKKTVRGPKARNALNELLGTLDESWSDGHSCFITGDSPSKIGNGKLAEAPLCMFGCKSIADYDIADERLITIMEFNLDMSFDTQLLTEPSFLDLLSAEHMRFGVTGFGIFIPPAFASVLAHATPYLNRYRLALWQSGEAIVDNVYKTIALNERLGRDGDCGLPALGWQNIIGSEFLSRMGSKELDVLLGRRDGTLFGKNLFVQLGKAPIWGDINISESIDEYQQLGKQLTDISLERSAWALVEEDGYESYQRDYYSRLFGNYPK